MALNDLQHQYLRESVQKLNGAIETFTSSKKALSQDEVDRIKQELSQVKSELFMIADTNGNIANVDLFMEAADLLEKTLNLIYEPYSHLI